MGRYNKFWVATLVAVTQFVRITADIDLGIDEASAATLVSGIGAALVWLVPNR